MGQVLSNKEKTLKICEAISVFEKTDLITGDEKNTLCRYLIHEDFESIGNFIGKKAGINPYLETLIDEVLIMCY